MVGIKRVSLSQLVELAGMALELHLNASAAKCRKYAQDLVKGQRHKDVMFEAVISEHFCYVSYEQFGAHHPMVFVDFEPRFDLCKIV